jgi:hypothetical protein
MTTVDAAAGWEPLAAKRPAKPTQRPKLVFEKVFFLNPSRSKRLTIGLDLDRDLSPCAVLEGNSGAVPSVMLSDEAFTMLLSNEWRATVKRHMDKLEPLPTPTRVLPSDCHFHCISLPNNEPALKIRTSNAFIILGAVSVQTLYWLRPALATKMLALDAGRVRSWLRYVLDDIKRKTSHQLRDETDIKDFLEKNAEAMIKRYDLDAFQADFMMDLCFRYRDSFIELIYKAVIGYDEVDG